MNDDLKSKKLMVALFILLATVYGTNAACVFSSPIQVKDLAIGNLITWNTSEEKDNELFIVQRSLDGVTFSAVGQVSGAGNSAKELSYRFLDAGLGAQKAFYRLAQLDTKGGHSFTEAVMINRAESNNYVITVMSATSTERFFTATITSEVEGFLEYRLLNQNEETVKSGAMYLKTGANTFSLDLKRQTPAKYKLEFLMLKEKETIYLRKVASKVLEKLNLARKSQKD
ncbi:MAG: hypothetical protein AB8G15_10940 [Saprospiraceae bacterium]